MSELKHHGIKGMKWGVRKSKIQLRDAKNRAVEKNKAYKSKVKMLAEKNNGVHRSDADRFNKQKLKLRERVWDNLTPAVTQAFMGDIFSGDAKFNDKEYMTKKIISITTSTIGRTTLDDMLAYSASRKYTSSGKLIKGDVHSLFTREDILGTVPEAISMVKSMVPSMLAAKKAASDSYNKAANVDKDAVKAKVGTNVLNTSVKDLIVEELDTLK